MSFGFFAKVLHVDLTNRTTTTSSLDAADVKKYYLGSGLASVFLMRHFDLARDPLDEASPLLFFSGLFTGGLLPGTSKLSVVARSPQTGIWNEATVGGHWPAQLRKTGLDGIVLLGRASEPVYLVITTDDVQIRPAAHLWGKDTYEVGRILKEGRSDRARVACIGPAGEQGVLISSILFDPPNSRVAARGGIGAVMGAKNLKAIVVEGDPKLAYPVAHPEELKVELETDRKEITKNTVGLTNFGTSGGVETVEMYGDLPIKNWQLGSWKEGARKVAGQAMQPMMLDHHYSCFACPIRCAKIYKNEKRGLFGHGPEYETIGMLGASCLNDDPELLAEGNEWCNRYGIDTISAGSCCGFAIEAFERGALTTADTGGVTLDWNGQSMLALIHLMGRQEHVGKVLGQGVRRAAQVLGKNSSEYAVHTKGLEYPAHDPRGHVGMALNYATASRGACHLEGLTYFLDRGIPVEDLGYTTPPDPHRSDDKPPIVVNMQNYMAVFNPLGMCKFLFIGRVGPKKIARWLNLVCGWDVTMDDVLKTGERLFNLKRVYNNRLGISRKDDILPPRLYAQAKPEGAAKDVLPDLGSMLYRYYQLRCWTPDGIPTRQKLEELGILEGQI
ncbi:MAG: aldehyde ferredoxin oxidoreductase family protein [Candidatus Riflebacteria bacterium]|nr:aldehyde ferredoxin oxidoreductase family protein [Candidatus Riflebacteria bacterium]